jgi:pyoverdine/dityrosine biosynthesis protein
MERTVSEQAINQDDCVYQVGVDEIREQVISSHFMHKLCKDSRLDLYDEQTFSGRSVAIETQVVYKRLLPSLMRASAAFSRERAAAAKQRARENHRAYGLKSKTEVGHEEYLTEVMFDPQFRRRHTETCARPAVRDEIRERVRNGLPIEMVIPALPFKFSSPLKSRGPLPDLGDLNFILGLYEIVTATELLYREACPELPGSFARFTVVSDGSRFNCLVGESDGMVSRYRAYLRQWVDRLGLQDRIEILDYDELLRQRLPTTVWETKSSFREKFRVEYANALWPIFDPEDTAATLVAALRSDPDPESSNVDGRFVSLLRSLVHTIRYQTLERLPRLPARTMQALYRELSAHLFESYSPDIKAIAFLDITKEQLRQSMLREAWQAAINYMAEIKSDRELPSDPILDCLPHFIRWTIHPKSAQLAISTATAMGISVQSWAGAGVFKLTKNSRIKLCTLPVLALEGVGATPVCIREADSELEFAQQPLFYVYPDIQFADIDELLDRIGLQLVRKRAG